MKKFILASLLFAASTALAETGQVVCASSDMNGGVHSAQTKLNNALKNMTVKSASAPVIVVDTYFVTMCVTVTKQ